MAMSNFVSTAKLNPKLHTLSYNQVFLCHELLLLDAGALFGWIETVDKGGRTHLKKRSFSNLDGGEQQRLLQIISASSIGGSFKQLSSMQQGTVARQILNMAYGCLQKTRLVFVNRLENENPFFPLEPLDTLKAKVASSLADVFPLTGDNRQTIASIFLCTAWSVTTTRATQDKLDQLHLTLADCKLSFPGTQFYTFEATKDNANQMRTYINANRLSCVWMRSPNFISLRVL